MQKSDKKNLKKGINNMLECMDRKNGQNVFLGKMLSWAYCLLWANCHLGHKIFGQNVFLGKLSPWAFCLWAKYYLGHFVFGHFENLGILTFNHLYVLLM